MRGLPVLVLGLLAASGCLAGDHPFGPHDETREARFEEEFPGLEAAGTLTGGGDAIRLDALARNQGPRTYRVYSICVNPWGESMAGRFGEVHRLEPTATCAAFGLRDFKPGESLPFQATWNGTLWDSQAERYERAPSGDYLWRAAFSFYRDEPEPRYDSAQRLVLEFHATVR